MAAGTSPYIRTRLECRRPVNKETNATYVELVPNALHVAMLQKHGADVMHVSTSNPQFFRTCQEAIALYVYQSVKQLRLESLFWGYLKVLVKILCSHWCIDNINS